MQGRRPSGLLGKHGGQNSQGDTNRRGGEGERPSGGAPLLGCRSSIAAPFRTRVVMTPGCYCQGQGQAAILAKGLDLDSASAR